MTIEYQGDGIIDNKQAIQVHDYLGVSFFRMDSKQRSTTKQIVDLMSKVCFNKSAGAYIKHHFLRRLTLDGMKQHYPETMKAKYMVNVPFVMSWVMTFIKTFVSRETMSKITVLTYGSALCGYIHHKDLLPKPYGGKSEDTLASLSLQQCIR